MKPREILAHVDHTELMPTAKWEDIQSLCDTAVFYNTASICIPPAYIRRAKEYLKGRMKIDTVIGFPHGYNTTEVKVFEVKDAIANGADELDMVVNIGWVRDGLYENVLDEIRQIKAACGEKPLKVIIETGVLTDEEKIAMCRVITEAGADYIKTCTGFNVGKATVEDIALFKANIGPDVKMKASSGMTSLEEGEVFLKMGCDRLGSKLLANIAKQNGVE